MERRQLTNTLYSHLKVRYLSLKKTLEIGSVDTYLLLLAIWPTPLLGQQNGLENAVAGQNLKSDTGADIC
jgi:hypothetical protein